MNESRSTRFSIEKAMVSPCSFQPRVALMTRIFNRQEWGGKKRNCSLGHASLDTAWTGMHKSGLLCIPVRVVEPPSRGEQFLLSPHRRQRAITIHSTKRSTKIPTSVPIRAIRGQSSSSRCIGCGSSFAPSAQSAVNSRRFPCLKIDSVNHE